MVLVAALLASENRLVVGIDATGNLLNVPSSSFEENYSQKLFHPYLLAEKVSPSNKTRDVSDWILQLRKDTILATESYAGAGDGIDPIPSVIKMDCAMELINGCLAGYRSCHHVTTGQLYNNVVIFILLRHDFLMLNVVDGSEAKIVSKNTYARILALSPCIFKQCKSHLWRAVKNYRRHKSSPPTEFRFELIAKEMTIIR
eukprot:scaffold15505_cov134-Skeletonema_marinoi.AAC.1